ncbi:MAG: hypothetical protein EVA89_31175 [Sandaracinaceae bacterium]|nr:MAG: hypothetical protein EVA89_31175 [Sandaracinaceae bacterium]
MLLRRVEVSNYKCFREPTSIELDPGMSVIVGRNNVGKTALLEAIEYRFGHRPHRGVRSMPRRGDQPPRHSCGVAEIEVTGAEIEAVVRAHRGPLRIAVPVGERAEREQGERLLGRYLDPSTRLLLTPRRPSGPTFEMPGYLGRYEAKKGPGDTWLWHEYQCDDDRELPSWRATVAQPLNNEDLRELLFKQFSAGVYAFRAERMKVGQCQFGRSTELKPDASNLPEVLNILQHNPARLRRYNEHVRRVLPQISWVSVRPVQSGGGLVEVLVWSGPPDAERDDLAIPLMECGTGVSQVLAMLYVVLTADSPKTILIDEPSSFLHPGGVAALLQVFSEYPQHQYVLSTHAPAVISGADPKRLYVIENEANEARPIELDPHDVEEQRVVLDAVGARLSDIFGPSRILWLEGRTEERCFPMIARALLGTPDVQVAMVAVVNTGDFDRRLVKTTAEVYRRLSAGIGLIPPACGFVFDREGLSADRQARLREACGSKLEFIPRRMYENYLLCPRAVASVLNQTETFKDGPLEASSVAEWIEANRARFGGGGDDWLVEIDGGRLLGALFGEMSKTKERYDKVHHGIQLTSWLVENDQEALREVADVLAKFLESQPTAAATEPTR